jgi:hypothetical protein
MAGSAPATAALPAMSDFIKSGVMDKKVGQTLVIN